MLLSGRALVQPIVGARQRGHERDGGKQRRRGKPNGNRAMVWAATERRRSDDVHRGGITLHYSARSVAKAIEPGRDYGWRGN